MKATNIQWQSAKKGGFVTADIELLTYQMWFPRQPHEDDVIEAVDSFEINYAGLNKQARIPVKVKQHHSEVE